MNILQLMIAWSARFAFPDGVATMEGDNLIWTSRHIRVVVYRASNVECEGIHGSLLETAMIAQRLHVEALFA